MHLSCAPLALLGFVLALQDALAKIVTLLPIPFSFYDIVDSEIEGFIIGSDGAGRTTYIMSDNDKVVHISLTMMPVYTDPSPDPLTHLPMEAETLTPGFIARRADNLRIVTYTLGAGSAIATMTDEDIDRNLHTIVDSCAFRSGNSGTADCQHASDAQTSEYVTEASLKRVILLPDSHPQAVFTTTTAPPAMFTNAPTPQRTVMVTVPYAVPGANPRPGVSPTTVAPMPSNGLVATSTPSIQTTAPGLPTQDASGSTTVLPANGNLGSQSGPFDPNVTTIFVTADPTPLGDLPSRKGEGVRHTSPSTLQFTFVLSLVLSILQLI